jgi:hypothetical protein
MDWLVNLLDISLHRANQFYTWGWRLSAFGAAITVIGVVLLWWGTRVRDHEFETQMTSLNVEAGQARERAGKLEERAAGLERDAARLRLELDREIQKRAPRFLMEDQKSAMLAELRGRIQEIAIVVQNDLEAQAFSVQFVGLFGDAGAKIYAPEAPREDKWFAPAGLIMYSPLGQTEDQLKDDPLYRALKAVNLFGGTTSRPFISPQIRGPVPTLIPGYNGHVLYIGQRSPF